MLTPKHTIWDESQMHYKGNVNFQSTNSLAILFSKKITKKFDDDFENM
jgi:hypothetical protein